MAVHRYWRIYCETNIPAQNVSIAELALASSIGGSNLCGSGTPAASSFDVRAPGFPASNAFDGNPSTFWSSQDTLPLPQWLSYDFGSGIAFDIVEAVMTGRNDAFPQYGPDHFNLEWSDDNSTWHPAATFFAATWTSGAVQTFDAANGSYTYWNQTQGGGNFAYTGGGRTATATGTNNILYASTLRHSGKAYFESLIVVHDPASQDQVGIQGIAQAGTEGNGTGIGAYTTTLAGFGNGSTVCIAVDFDAALIWIRIGSGLWNASGTADPASGIGGVSISSTAGGVAYGWMPSIGDSQTFAALDAEFAFAKPAGFVAWGGASASPAGGGAIFVSG